jgi:hypothetical protein
MKKTLSVLISALLAFAGLTVVSAPAHAADRTVTIHYHRFDGAYDGRTIWAWGTGNEEVSGGGNGGQDGVYITDIDENAAKFGATFSFVVSDDTVTGFGFIVRNGNNWDDGRDYEGTNVENGNKSPVINETGDTEMWIVFGSNTVYYEEPAFPQAVDSPAASVKVGKLIKLDARTDKAAVVTWTSKTKKVCSVVMKSGKPKLKGLKKGLCRVKAVAVGVGEYGAYSKTIALYVN